MKNIAYFLLIIFSCLIVGCECEDAQMENPLEDPDTFRVTGAFYDGQSEVTIFFNKPADVESVIAEESLILSPTEQADMSDHYQVEFWSDDSKTLIVELDFSASCSITFPGVPCPIELRMISDKDAPLSVRSATGQLLDGNNDGSDGDDYLFNFFE